LVVAHRVVQRKLGEMKRSSDHPGSRFLAESSINMSFTTNFLSETRDFCPKHASSGR
jgi:hypothetical protein